MARDYFKMIIGVDARPLSLPLTGIGQYTYQLLKRMVKMGHTWYLFSHRPLQVVFEEKSVHCVTHQFRSRWTSTFWAQCLLPRWLKKYHVDVAWFPRHHIPYFGLSSSLKVVLTIHDLVYRYFPETMRFGSGFLERLLQPYSIKRADAVITVSQAIARELCEEMGVPADKLSVIYEGAACDEAVYPKTILKTWAIDREYILFIGTLEPRKNLKRLIAAYAQLPELIRKQYLLVLVGQKGWGRENIEDQVRQFHLEPYVRITGYVDDSARLALLQHATLLAMPSLYEGFGLPLVEAMFYNVPLLTSNQGAVAEVAGEAGLLVDPMNVSQLSEALKRLLTDQALRDQLKRNAEKRKSLFSWDRAAEKTFCLLTQEMNTHVCK